ncbi:hypothetical protein ABK249_15195 [Neorhizobium sp. Rsf11]|uniref:YitH/HolE acetyltransferase (GNAT) domain-containing protein n=2 Tax=Neorhizobium TaxID=1525371 RepID=A0ABV0M5I4_9HYPH|nr:hypothetical protein [Neorhizobium petrolearium]WGI69673.1 hypothetical protein QEO92_06285 [Neorhizobium petrolearium]
MRSYSMRRRFGRGHLVDPVVAACDADAIRVTHPQVVAHAGGFLRIDTHFDKGAFASFVQQCGLSVHYTVTTMVTREEASYGTGQSCSATVYALASHSLG